MYETDKIKVAVERSQKAISLKPALGRSTAVSTTRIVNGLTCEIVEGNWKLSADMPEGIGGNNTAPTPGVYGRAALGSCLAMGYMMKAAAMNIPVSRLEVEVQADYDDGALLGTADATVPPGYLEIRYTVTIETDADEERILEILNEGDKYSPYLDVFSRAQHCVRKINIVNPQTNT